jgi:hypothetical protein
MHADIYRRYAERGKCKEEFVLMGEAGVKATASAADSK